MFTSGSTGRPKGVIVAHRGVARLVRETNYIRITREDTLLLLSPITFDASTFEIWGRCSTARGLRSTRTPRSIRTPSAGSSRASK